MNPAHASSQLLRGMRGLIFLAVCFGASVAQAGIKSERLLAAILKQTPASTLVAPGQQMKQAEELAAGITGAQVLWGVGESMEPLYTSRTAVVVAPIAFKDLEKGMTVVYLSRRGTMVAHSLTGDLPKGWIAQGVNNDEEDDDLVTKNNLVGVIVQAFSEMPSTDRVALTKQLIAKGRLAADHS
jgi:hypothetical protein